MALVNVDGRRLARACRCQLLVGSYTGATRTCPCFSPAYCELTAQERIDFEKHPAVLRAKQRNLKEFEALNKKTI